MQAQPLEAARNSKTYRRIGNVDLKRQYREIFWPRFVENESLQQPVSKVLPKKFSTLTIVLNFDEVLISLDDNYF